MNLVIQQTKRTIISCCHLQLEQQRYAVARSRIDIESDV